MSESLFSAVVIGVILLLLGMFALAIWLARRMASQAVTESAYQSTDPRVQRQEQLLAKARKACGAQACCKCKNWDLDGGQIAIMQNPAFRAASQSLTPNKMGRKADEAGPFSLPIALDTWELIGACSVDNIGTHATGTCDSFQKA